MMQNVWECGFPMPIFDEGEKYFALSSKTDDIGVRYSPAWNTIEWGSTQELVANIWNDEKSLGNYALDLATRYNQLMDKSDYWTSEKLTEQINQWKRNHSKASLKALNETMTQEQLRKEQEIFTKNLLRDQIAQRVEEDKGVLQLVNNFVKSNNGKKDIIYS